MILSDKLLINEVLQWIAIFILVMTAFNAKYNGDE